MMPEDGLDQLREHDSILLGAVGWPGVPDHVSLWGLLIPIRRGFDQYASVRPCKLMPGARTPLANRTEKDIDFIVVRENTEGEYSAVGGRMYRRHRARVRQRSRRSSAGAAPTGFMKYAFEMAQKRPRKHLTSATKSNGIIRSPCRIGTSASLAMKQHYPDGRRPPSSTSTSCAPTSCSIPDWFDVVVGSNLFGDILSDLGPAVAGSIGIAPSANLNPEKPASLDVRAGARLGAGHRRQGDIANPIGQIWSAAMMLDHLGEAEAAQCIIDSFEALLREGGPRTRDMGGQAGTVDVGRAIAAGA